MSTAAQLEELWDGIREDTAFDPLRIDGVRLVPGVGTYTPKVFIVGDNPGAQENLHKRPFCGAPGNILFQLMGIAGLDLGNSWLTYTLKYRIPGGRVPVLYEIMKCQPYLRREWVLLGGPSVVVTVGGIAWQALGRPEVWNLRGIAGNMVSLRGNNVLWPMLHPAYGLRHPEAQGKMERDWESLGGWLKEEGIL